MRYQAHWRCDRLRGQHPVERVAVYWRQFPGVYGMLCGDGQEEEACLQEEVMRFVGVSLS
ncbi:hypothetical protein AGMMS50289_09700 [Betaproteobacteria bacterium]|nr:hypothetical protein AGMMS50289_09700 [Betaproteobacteria bacterium]